MRGRGKSLTVDVNPKVIAWALTHSGWTKESLAKKLALSDATLEGWLKGTKQPTISQLESLASVLKRPLASFFLADPPKEVPLPKDYRMLPERDGTFDNKTVLAIRRARRLQRLSKEMAHNLHTGLASSVPSAHLSDDLKGVVKKFTGLLGLTTSVRGGWKSPYEAFRFFRNRIEQWNVIVFKLSMPLDDARGFTLADEEPAVIVVNSKDLPEAQVFTLLHELGHVVLRRSGIGIPDNAFFSRSVDEVEAWCNEFAGGLLLPADLTRAIFSESSRLTDTGTLNSLAKRLNVSKAMLLYTMHKLNYISREEYSNVLGRFNPLKIEKKKGKKMGGAPAADKRCLSERGQAFVSLVSKNYDKGYITRSDALDYLAIKSKSLEKVLSNATK